MANRSIESGPDTAAPIWIGSSGRSQIFAESTWKKSPAKFTRSPVSSERMISIASSSMSCRSPTAGQRSPTTCSLRFSPAPTLSWNRPSESTPSVAAFCATTAGWYRRVGQVT